MTQRKHIPGEIHLHPVSNASQERTFFADGKLGRVTPGLRDDLEGPETTVEILGKDGDEVAHAITIDKSAIDRDPDISDSMARTCVAHALAELAGTGKK